MIRYLPYININSLIYNKLYMHTHVGIYHASMINGFSMFLAVRSGDHCLLRDVWKFTRLCSIWSDLHRERPSRSDFGLPFTPSAYFLQPPGQERERTPVQLLYWACLSDRHSERHLLHLGSMPNAQFLTANWPKHFKNYVNHFSP